MDLNDLYPFQQEGVAWLGEYGRAYLGDEMGLGKTVQTIMAARMHDLTRRVLVVAPASAIENWKAELEVWFPEATWDFTSYSYLTRHPHDYTRAWKQVILDEAHYCKNMGAKRTKIALKVAESAERAHLLSGTPIPNDITELYPVLRYLWPRFLVKHNADTLARFRNKFTKWYMSDYGPKVVGNLPLAKEIPGAMNFLRRRVQDVELELPELRVDLHHLPFDAGLQRRIEEEAKALTGVDDMQRPYMSTVRRVLGMYKSPFIAEQVKEELSNGLYKKVVVLAHHLDVLADLRLHFADAGLTYVGFDGAATPNARQQVIKLFNERDDVQIFLAQQTAAGVAINLQSANELILVEPDWVPATNAQAIKRIHRIGQTRPCRARIFTVRGTLDEAIMRSRVRKIRMIQEVLGEHEV